MGNKSRYFSPEEIEYIRSHYGKQRNADIAAALGRTKRSYGGALYVLDRKKNSDGC